MLAIASQGFAGRQRQIGVHQSIMHMHSILPSTSLLAIRECSGVSYNFAEGPSAHRTQAAERLSVWPLKAQNAPPARFTPAQLCKVYSPLRRLTHSVNVNIVHHLVMHLRYIDADRL
jgi:hypothetical protein